MPVTGLKPTSGVLNSVAMTYIEDNFKTLYKNDRILRLNWESFHKILSSDRLNVENEDKVIRILLIFCIEFLILPDQRLVLIKMSLYNGR